MASNAETASVLLSTPKNCVHLHQYQTTGRWGAWVRDKRIKKGARLFVGTHKTRYLAARCQDRANLMIRHRFRGDGVDEPLKLNFKEVDYEEDEDLRNSLTVEAFIELLISESRESYKKTENKSRCLEKFLADVEQGRVADEIELLAHTSQTEEVKNIKTENGMSDYSHNVGLLVHDDRNCSQIHPQSCRLEAKPDIKGKNKITDIGGEPSQVAPKISDEEMAKLLAAKQYCSICKKVWLKDEEGNFVQCDICILWVHAPCANLTKKKMKELQNGASYHCPDCRKAHSANISSEDQQNLDMIKLADKKENSTPANANLPHSTAVQAPTRTSRRKRISDNTEPAAKVAKTCDSRPDNMRSAEQTDVGSTSINAISRCCMAPIDLNLPYFADPELSEEHQAAFNLCLLKNSNNMPHE